MYGYHVYDRRDDLKETGDSTQEVRPFVEHADLARRLGAAIVVSLGVGIVTRILGYLVTLLSAVWQLNVGPVDPWSIIARLPDFAIWIGGSIAVWAILAYWQRRLDREGRIWLLSWRGFQIVGLILFLLVLSKALPHTWVRLVDVDVSSLAARRSSTFVNTANWSALACAHLIACVAWIWWCDRPPRVPYAAVCGAGGWLGYQVAWMGMSLFLAGHEILIARPNVQPPIDAESCVALLQHRVDSTVSWEVLWHWTRPLFFDGWEPYFVLRFLAGWVAPYVLSAAVALGIYVGIKYVRGGYAAPAQQP